MEDRNFRRRLMMSNDPLPTGFRECEYVYPTTGSFAYDIINVSSLIAADDNIYISTGEAKKYSDDRQEFMLAAKDLNSTTSFIYIPCYKQHSIPDDPTKITIDNDNFGEPVYIYKYEPYNVSVINNNNDDIIRITDVSKEHTPYVWRDGEPCYEYIPCTYNAKSKDGFQDIMATLGKAVIRYRRRTEVNPVTPSVTRIRIFYEGRIFRLMRISDKYGKLKMNLIPCYNSKDNTYGVYDTVGKEYYTPVGTKTELYMWGKLKSSNSGGGQLLSNNFMSVILLDAERRMAA